MSGCSRESLPNIREWLGGPPGYPGAVGRHARCPGVVKWLSRMSGSGQEALPDIREWSGDPHGYPEVAGRPPRLSMCGW